MVTVSYNGRIRENILMLDYRGVGLGRFHCILLSTFLHSSLERDHACQPEEWSRPSFNSVPWELHAEHIYMAFNSIEERMGENTVEPLYKGHIGTR